MTLTRSTLLACGVLLVSAEAGAVDIAVTTTADEQNADGDCSLREALQAAITDAAVDACAAGGGSDVVSLGAGAFTTSSAIGLGDTELRGAGSGATTITLGGRFGVSGGAAARISDVTLVSGAVGLAFVLDAELTLARVAVVGAALTVPAAVDVQFDTLGDRPRLVIEDSSFEGFSGAPVVSLVAGSLAIERSTFSGNSGDASGGAVVARGDSGAGDAVFIANSTFSGNSTSGSGGALSLSVAALVESCTIVANDAAVAGGGISAAPVDPVVRNSILLANGAPDGANCKQLGAGDVSGDFNLLDDAAGCTFGGAADSVIGAGQLDVTLGALADNGGHAATRAPLAGGAAVDSGGCAGGSADARGAVRADGRCDRGAVELGAVFTAPVVVVTAEPAGANCAGGGSRVAVGADDGAGDLTLAGDGALHASEVDAVAFVCDDDIAPTLVAVEADPTCASGGIAVHSGVDDDGDGVLDVAERDRTDQICNGDDGAPGADGGDGADGSDGAQGPPGIPGADGEDGAQGPPGADGDNGGPGPASLIRASEIDAGDSGCSAGGQLIEAGVDDGAGGGTAGDGVLQTGEVDSSAVLCNGRSFEDDFEVTGGPTCAGVGVGGTHGAPLAGLALLTLVLRRRRRR